MDTVETKFALRIKTEKTCATIWIDFYPEELKWVIDRLISISFAAWVTDNELQYKMVVPLDNQFKSLWNKLVLEYNKEK